MVAAPIALAAMAADRNGSRPPSTRRPTGADDASDISKTLKESPTPAGRGDVHLRSTYPASEIETRPPP
jgi:hypothetical protein